MSSRPALASSILAAAVLAAFAAGCGARPAGVASVSVSTTTATGSESGAVVFARCMRSHGAPNWPDPTSGGVFDKSKLQQLGINPTRVRAIEDGPCNHLLPAQGEAQPETHQQAATRQADALSFARCMRNRGVTRFPDPTAQGQLTIEMVEGQGIDVHSPAILRVVQACLPASHGALTPAKIREALANTHG